MVYRVAEDELRSDGPVEPADVGGVPEPRVDAVRHQAVVLPLCALKKVRHLYRVDHLLWEIIMLTPNLKLR